MFNFKRPENLAVPQVYHTFKTKNKNNEEIIEYRVQDLPEEYYEQTVDFMVKYFLPDETLCVSLNIPNVPEAAKVFRNMWTDTLKLKFSIGCFKNDGSDELVGANVLLVHSKSDPKDDKKSGVKEIENFIELIHYTVDQFDIYKEYNVDHYLTAYGLCVNPEYRGCGIATEMLKARAPILRALNLKVTSTAFTAIGSQKAAAKAGYKEVYEIEYSKVQEMFPSFDFSKSATKSFKTLALEIESTAT